MAAKDGLGGWSWGWGGGDGTNDRHSFVLEQLSDSLPGWAPSESHLGYLNFSDQF